MAPPPIPTVPPILDVVLQPLALPHPVATLRLGEAPQATESVPYRLDARFELRRDEAILYLIEPRTAFDLKTMRPRPADVAVLTSPHGLVLADAAAQDAAGDPFLLRDGRSAAHPEVLRAELLRILACPLPRKGKGRKDTLTALTSIALLVMDPKLCETQRWARPHGRALNVSCAGPGIRHKATCSLFGYTPAPAGRRLLDAALARMSELHVLDGWLVKSTSRGGTHLVPRDLRLALPDSQSASETLEHRIRAADWGAEAFAHDAAAAAAWTLALSELIALSAQPGAPA